MRDALALSAVAAGAFANEFFGLVDHTLHVPVYQGDVKLFVDAIAIVCAGTIATLQSMKKRSTLSAALLDSSVPISLAFVAPSIFIPSIVHTFRHWKGTMGFLLPFTSGLIFIAFLASTEKLLTRPDHAVDVVRILSAIIVTLILLRNAVGTSEAHATDASAPRLLSASVTIVALFAAAMCYSHPDVIHYDTHAVLAALFGSLTLAVSCYGMYVQSTEQKMPTKNS